MQCCASVQTPAYNIELVSFFCIIRYMNNQHLVDVTEIFNLLNWEKKKRLIKLGYLLFILFLSLFWYVTSTVASESANDHPSSENKHFCCQMFQDDLDDIRR